MSIFNEDSKIVKMIEKEYDNSDYIHVNIPSNSEAIEMYKSEIEGLKDMKPNDYDLFDFNDTKEFNETMKYLENTLNYYMEIGKIYEKTNILIENNYSYDLNDMGLNIMINPETKNQLKEAIKLLVEKLNEFDEYQSEFYMVMM